MPTNSIFLHYFFKGINSLWGLSLSCNFIQNSHQQIACVIDYNPFPQSLPLEAGVQPMVFWIPAGPISYHPLPSLHGSYDNTAGHFYTMKVPIAFFFEIHSVRGKKQSWHLSSLGGNHCLLLQCIQFGSVEDSLYELYSGTQDDGLWANKGYQSLSWKTTEKSTPLPQSESYYFCSHLVDWHSHGAKSKFTWMKE